MIAAIGIGKVIKDTLSSSLNEGAALQQSLGGIETLFKGSADIVKGYAKEAYKTTGLSANAYMESVTGFSASLLQSLGGDTGKAAEIANMAMVDMSDNANKMGTSMESIQFAYQGFAKQNYTMLDNLKLGYGGTKEEMQRLLTDAQKLTGVKYDINNLSDVYQAIHAIQENLDITGTTAKEASSTFTGSFASMKAAAQNVLGNMALGEDLTPSLEALKETVKTFVFGNFIPMLKNAVKAIPEVLGFAIKEGLTAIFGESTTQTIINNLSTAFQNIKSAVGGIRDLFGGFIDKLKGILGISGDVGELGTAFEGITGAISTVTDWIKQFVDWINQTPAAVDSVTAVLAGVVGGFTALLIVNTVQSAIEKFTTALKVARGVWWLFNAVVAANPFVSIVVGVSALVAALTWFFTQTETGKAIWQGFTEFLSSAWTSISSFLIDTWNNIAQTATAIWEGIVSVATAIWSAITGAIMAVVQPFIDAFMGLWNGMSSGISQVFDGYVTYFAGIWEVIKSVFLGAILIIIDLVTLNFGQLGTDLGSIWDGISNGISMMWDGITSIFSGAVSAIVGGVQATFNGMAEFLSGLWDAISGAAIAGWNGLVSGVQGIIDGLVSGAQAAWDAMSNAVSSLVSGITGIFDGLWNIDLGAAGQAIMDGFLGGLKAAWGAVTDFVGGVANWIRDHKGPIEYDRKLLIPAGNAIMEGLDQGLQDQFKDVKQTVGGMVDEISDVFSEDNLDFNSSVSLTKTLETQLAMPSTQFEARESKTVSEIANLRASMERILTAILEKSSDVYLDNDIISLKTYEQHGAIYAREGI
jgi:pblA